LRTSVIVRFEELLELWRTEFRGVPLAQLLGLTEPGGETGVDHYAYPAATLRERFRGTWWHVSLPGPAPQHGTVQCTYVGDRPHAHDSV